MERPLAVVSCTHFVKIACCLRTYNYAGGAPPTDVTTEQTGVSTVLVM